MKDNETIKDILRDMRDFAEHRDFDSDGNMSTTALRVFADRTEAAWQQDRSDAMKTAMMCKCEVCHSVQGSAAEMREALEHIEKLTREFNVGNYSRPDYTQWVIDSVRFALAAPARNCDRFTNSHDAIEAFENEIDYLKEGGADYGDLAAWLFSRAEGGAE